MTEKKEKPSEPARPVARPSPGPAPDEETDPEPDTGASAGVTPSATPTLRDPADRAPDDWTPAEAIAELDQLQSELERLRRPRRAPDP